MSPISVLEELNGNDSDHYFDPATAGRFADLAIQQRLGILPERRAGTDPGDYHPACPHGAGLDRLGSTLRWKRGNHEPTAAAVRQARAFCFGYRRNPAPSAPAHRERRRDGWLPGGSRD